MKEIDINAHLTNLVETEFAGLHSGGGRSSIKGGQSAAENSGSTCATGINKERSDLRCNGRHSSISRDQRHS
jgi:hypothetical protein